MPVRPDGRPARKPLVLFAFTILLPGVLLALFGLRALIQERHLAQDQVRRRIEQAADAVTGRLERDAAEWRRALATIDGRGNPHLSLPDALRHAVSLPGVAAVLINDTQSVIVWPHEQTLFELGPAHNAWTASPSNGFGVAERAELIDRNYTRAAALYRRALTAEPREPTTLLRLARSLNKAGQAERALAVYSELTSSTGAIGPVPAALIGAHETSAILESQGKRSDAARVGLETYRALVSSRWRLDHARYRFYASEARRHAEAVAETRNEAARLASVEARKLELSEALSEAVERGRVSGGQPAEQYLTILAAPPHSATMLIGRDWLVTRYWPDAFRDITTLGMDVAMIAPGGGQWYPATEARVPGAPVAVERMLGASLEAWRVRVSPRDLAQMTDDGSPYRGVYLTMIVLNVGLLAYGTYLTLRLVRTERAVAQLQSEFVATVSHEFRSPLTGIRQLGEMLMQGRVPSEERRREYYARITHESDRLARLVENVLEVAQMEEGRRAFRMERLDTSGWLGGVVDDARAQRAEAAVSIVADIAPELPALAADPAALASVIHNLLDNAIKYSPHRDVVWISATAVGGDVRIAVRDEGVGMSEDDMRHAFERFYRSRADITKTVKGAGLGLSLVDRVVRAHGGAVKCESALGVGTTFSIHLPALED